MTAVRLKNDFRQFLGRGFDYYFDRDFDHDLNDFL